jgi:hypothetical protein
MEKEKQRKPVQLTEDQKLLMLKEYDESGCHAKQIIARWGIAHKTFYNTKKSYWELYLSTKDSYGIRDKISNINAVKLDNSRKMATVERRAGDVLSRMLNMIENKIEREEQRMAGELTVDPREIVTINDLTNFFKAAAPYFLRLADGSAPDTLSKKHSFFTQILNQQIINNGNKENTDTGIATQ